MKKVILLIVVCSISLFSCKSSGETDNKEKALLQREKDLLERENAALRNKQENSNQQVTPQQTPQNNPVVPQLTENAPQQNNPIVQQQVAENYFQGFINGEQGVTIDNMTSTTNNGFLEFKGYLRYGGAKRGNYVTGKVRNSDGLFGMTEWENSQPVSYYNGYADNDKSVISGTWTDAVNKTDLPFSLTIVRK